MDNTQNVLTRYTHPTKFDVAPYGTLWKEVNSSGDYSLFIQLGKDISETNAVNWVGIGAFLETAFKESLLKPEFINKCLELYEKKGDAWIL